LLHAEPEFDTAAGAKARAQLAGAEMVVTLSPFKANMDISDVLLPIAPFTETSGTFVNAEGRVQSFHAVVKPLAETRPAWKVLRVLANLLGLSGFDFESSQDVLAEVFQRDGAVPTHIDPKYLGNRTDAAIDLSAPQAQPVVASIYQLDGMVRRATSLQLTADARSATAPSQTSKEPA
jgi:NADH-quinone oxidoreductase subunit G